VTVAQDMERPHGFYTQAATTEVQNKQQRSADNGWSSSYEFRGAQKFYFKRNNILCIFAQVHYGGRLFDTGFV
jgi:hypothetical protein